MNIEENDSEVAVNEELLVDDDGIEILEDKLRRFITPTGKKNEIKI